MSRLPYLVPRGSNEKAALGRPFLHSSRSDGEGRSRRTFLASVDAVANAGEAEQHHRPGRGLGDGADLLLDQTDAIDAEIGGATKSGLAAGEMEGKFVSACSQRYGA